MAQPLGSYVRCKDGYLSKEKLIVTGGAYKAVMGYIQHVSYFVEGGICEVPVLVSNLEATDYDC